MVFINSSKITRHRLHPPRKEFLLLLQIISFSLLSFVVFINNVQSEIIEIPLPDLTGIYIVDTTRTVQFDLGQPISEVHHVWIRWSGDFAYGTGIGDGVIRPSDLFPLGGSVYACMDTPGLSHWYASSTPEEGSFQDTTDFIGFLDPTWDFLMDGVATVRIGVQPEWPLGGIMVVSPVVKLDTVFLIFDVEFATGVGNTSTWGQIKARFRSTNSSP